MLRIFISTHNYMKLVTLWTYLLFTCNLNAEKLAQQDQQELDDSDGFYKNETPAIWVDGLFALLMILHHTYYAYKFTDYSLSHIHSHAEEKEAKKIEKEEKKKLKKELKNKGKKRKKKKKNKNKNLAINKRARDFADSPSSTTAKSKNGKSNFKH